MKHLLVALLFSGSALLAADNPFTGTWKLNVSVAGNDSQATCTFTQKDVALTGTCKGDDGNAREVTGKIDEKKVTFQYKIEYNGEPLTLVYTGAMNTDDSLAGAVDVQPMGISGDFTAKRDK